MHWPDLAIIDGAECRGCFNQSVDRIRNEDTGEWYSSSICTWTWPECDCPPCRAFCGSELKINNLTFTVYNEPLSTGDGCLEVYLTPECDAC